MRLARCLAGVVVFGGLVVGIVRSQAPPASGLRGYGPQHRRRRHFGSGLGGQGRRRRGEGRADSEGRQVCSRRQGDARHHRAGDHVL